MIATYFIRYIFSLLAVVCFVSATDEAGTKYLEEKSLEDGVVTLPSGLRYKVLEKGSGAFHPKVNSPCLCHYGGTLIDGTEFDSSYSRGWVYVILYLCLSSYYLVTYYLCFYQIDNISDHKSCSLFLTLGNLLHLPQTKLSEGKLVYAAIIIYVYNISTHSFTIL